MTSLVLMLIMAIVCRTTVCTRKRSAVHGHIATVAAAATGRGKLTFRQAEATDAASVVPLILSFGTEEFRYVLEVPGCCTAPEFLHWAFKDGNGEFGHRNHVVALSPETGVVGVGAIWQRASVWPFALAAACQIFRCYGWKHSWGVIVRGLQLGCVLPPPLHGRAYIGHVRVHHDHRGRGVGSQLMAVLLAAARMEHHAGVAFAALNVAATNPRARALYERLGFVVVAKRMSQLVNRHGHVPHILYMEKTLQPLP